MVLRAIRTSACGFLAGVGALAGCGIARAAETPAAPATGNATGNATAAPDSFFVQAYDVSGVTRLSRGDVERLVYPHEGPGRTKDDVEAARKALQDAYAARGYQAVIVDVPVQSEDTFRHGIVQIAVSEVPVGQVRVTGSKYHALWVAKGEVPSLKEGQPVEFRKLQDDIALANRAPDRTINPVFKPGKVPGTLDVDLKVDDDRPVHASVQLDNDASPSTSPLRLTATARYTNLFQKGHAATFTYVVAPENPADTEVFAGSYMIPLRNSRWSLSLSGYYSNSNVASLGGSSVLGNGFQVGLRAIYRIPSEKLMQTLSFGPDFKNFKQNILVGTATASQAPIRYVPFELTYALAGATENSSYSFSLGGTFGLRALHGVVCIDVSGICVPADQFRNREQFSNENFVRVNLNAEYQHAFSGDAIVVLRWAGQLADSHLITNEQFSAGGMSSVRGYLSATAVGDEGIAQTIEVRSPSFAHLFGKALTEARLYAFSDSAYVRVRNPLADQTDVFRLQSLGAGVRVRLFDRVSGDVFAAIPMTTAPNSERGSPRVSFEVKGDF